MQFDIHETYEELRATWRHYDQIHRSYETSRSQHAAVEQQVADVRRALTAKLRDEIATDATIKIRFSNADLRDAEVARRMDDIIPDLLLKEEQLRQQKQMDQAELERSQEALKTMRVLAALVEAERRMEAVEADVASMPRIVTGRR